MCAIIEGTSLTDKILNTTICPVEHELNACPLAFLGADSNDLESPNPSQFLLLRTNKPILFLLSAERYAGLRKRMRNAQSYS